MKRFPGPGRGVGASGGLARPLRAASRNGLAAAYGAAAAVVTAENTGICVNVHAYTKAPPLRRAGWNRVTEVGLTVTGRTVDLVGLDGGKGPSVPVAKGPGAHRVRVHAGGRDVTERYLIALFPAR